MPTGKGPLRIAIEDFLEGFGFGDRIHNWLVKFIEFLEDAGVKFYGEMLNTFYPGVTIPPPYDAGSMGRLIKTSQNGFFFWLASITGLAFGGLFGLGKPAGMLSSYLMDRQLKSFRPSAQELQALLLRNPGLSDKFKNAFNDLGVDSDYQTAYANAMQQILTPNELETLRRKGAITQAQFIGELIQLGFTEERINQIIALRDLIPSVTDLITMQVREAFNDDFSQRFRHDEGDITQVTEWAAKQGLSEDWVKRYWRAHWQLPSPNQVFEMLHRLRPGLTENTIQAQDVDDYLKAADYSPFWRDRLKEISYSPYTRVDVRRMYKTGALNESEVKDAYLDLGYDEKHAQALTEFTIAFEAEEETGIVRSSVLSAYGDGQIDRATAENMLKSGGYDTTTIAFYLDNVDFKEGLEVQNIKIQAIKKKFIEGLLDESTVHSQLNALNLPAERITAMLELWLAERENQTALLSISQMETLLERGIVTSDDFKRIVKRRGYTDESIEWTLKRIAQEASEKAQKEAEQLAKDNERVQKSNSSSAYQKAKAQFELSIAQTRAEITDIDIALLGEINPDNERTLLNRIETIKQNIAEMDINLAEYNAETVSINIQIPNESDQSIIQALTDRKLEIKQAVADLKVVKEQAQADIVNIQAALKGILTADLVAELQARKAELKGTLATLNVAKAQLRFDTLSALSNSGVSNG